MYVVCVRFSPPLSYSICYYFGGLDIFQKPTELPTPKAAMVRRPYNLGYPLKRLMQPQLSQLQEHPPLDCYEILNRNY